MVSTDIRHVDIVPGEAQGRDHGFEFDLDWAAVTHCGSRRQENQDTFRFIDLLFVLCDGMGGHAGGSEASALTAEAFASAEAQATHTRASITTSIATANAAVLRSSESDADKAGMGSTLVAWMAHGMGEDASLTGVNVGDSRCYLLESGRFAQLSHDHSVVQELIDCGDLQPHDADAHPDRSVLTQAIGMVPAPKPFVWYLLARVGMRFLLCSDGIYREVGEPALTRILSHGQPDECVQAMADAVLDAGARDNFTAVVIDVNPSTAGVLEAS